MWQKVHNLLRNKYFLSLVGNIIMSSLGLITMALIYRVLSKSEAGTWVFFQSIVLLIDTFRSGFLTTAIIKFYSGSTQERAAQVVGSAWFLGLIITIILVMLSALSLLIINVINDDGVALFFKWSGVYYLLSLPWYLATCVIQSKQQFGKLLYIRLCNQGSFVLFIIGLIVVHRVSLNNVIYAYLLSSLITSIYVLIRRWSGVEFIKSRSKTLMLEIYHFGKYSVGTSLSSNLFSASDTLIINFMLGKPALAIYNLGQSLMQVVEIPLRSFAITAMPEIAAAFNENNRARVITIMKKYAGMLSIMLIPAALIGCVLADVPIYIIGGGKYMGTEAANVFRLFLTFAILFPPDRFFALTIDAIHRPSINFYKVLVMLAVNISSDFIGVYITHNVYGIAFATVLPILTGIIIGYWALNKYYKFSFWNIFKVGYIESILLLKKVRL